MKRWLIAVIVVVIVAIGVGAFFGGRAAGGGTPSAAEAMKVVSESDRGAAAGPCSEHRRHRDRDRRPDRRSSGAGGNMTSGSIVSSDANSMTVKLTDGSTKIVLFSDSTTISVSKDGSSADLTAGQTVRVNGTTNSDGSITASNIQCGTAAAGGAPPAGAAPSDTTGTTAPRAPLPRVPQARAGAPAPRPAQARSSLRTVHRDPSSHRGEIDNALPISPPTCFSDGGSRVLAADLSCRQVTLPPGGSDPAALDVHGCATGVIDSATASSSSLGNP